MLALGLLAGGVLAGQIGRPLRRLEAVARRVAQGDLRARAEVEGSLEQRSLSSSFNEMTDRIARLLGAQRDFVADASHQLRTPLTGLRLRLEEAQGARRGQRDAAERARRRRSPRSTASRTRSTSCSLLSRAGERQLDRRAVDLDDVAIDALAALAAAGGRARDRARARSATDDPGTVWAARADLERALDALVENALRYSPPGSAVTIAAAAGRIEVRDRGPGVAEEERELVFERFHRGTRRPAGPPGHGLGLAIARELAREWGGEVTIEAASGGGTAAMRGRSQPDEAQSAGH